MKPTYRRRTPIRPAPAKAEQLYRNCLAEVGGDPDKAIARLREIYLAQIKRAGSDYFARVKRVSVAAIDAFNSRQK